ncbi:MAG: alpha/beta hydrolase [Eggerthellaceae bacterium]|nr:alpha/beta hydrolase [Eggerthellaceae bacterium]
MVRVESTFTSSDGATAVRCVTWEPRDVAGGAQPRGIVQLVHGMAEHIGRYDDFARFLAANGYVACGHDHLGHGDSVAAPDDRGILPAHGGADLLVADVGLLRARMQERFPGVPYYLFGHSMGSLVTRVYIASHGAGLAGAVICGTSNPPLIASRAGNLLARAVAAVRGDDARSKLLHSLTDGAFARAIPDARTPFDWLSRDPAVADAFIADEAAGAMFSAGAYATLTELAKRAGSPQAYAGVPKDLPVLYIAGDADPVGDEGKGVTRSADDLRAAGVADVTLTLYGGMRHEILNEIGHEEVYADVLAWLAAHR